MLISPAYAQDMGGAGGVVMQLLPLILIFVVFYFLLIRPQQRKMKEHRQMLTELKRGDRVVTAGGIVAEIKKVSEGSDEIEAEIAPNVRVTVVRGTITSVIRPQPANDAAEARRFQAPASGPLGRRAQHAEVTHRGARRLRLLAHAVLDLRPAGTGVHAHDGGHAATHDVAARAGAVGDGHAALAVVHHLRERLLLGHGGAGEHQGGGERKGETGHGLSPAMWRGRRACRPR
jgi:preprotein translocase subunit YajC